VVPADVERQDPRDVGELVLAGLLDHFVCQARVAAGIGFANGIWFCYPLIV